jgi:hypothetical protein
MDGGEMATVSAGTSDSLYVLQIGEHYWLTTLATNRHDCYLAAKKFCLTDDYKKELKSQGYRCVKVRVVEA